MKRSVIATLTVVGLLSAAVPGKASTVDIFPLFCLSVLPGGAGVAPPQTCAESAVGGTGPSDPLGFHGSPVAPDALNNPGATSSTAGGSGGLSGTASATADFGVLKAKVLATNSYGLGEEPNPSIVARALASFNDTGLITSVGGVSGGLVHAKATLDVTSILSGFGEGNVKLVISGAGGRSIVNFEGLLFFTITAISKVFEFDTTPGEQISVASSILLQAVAGSSDFTINPGSSADLSNSAYLYIDLENAVFAAASGHDYRVDARVIPEVPLPAALPLFAGGLGVIGLALERRKRRAVAGLDIPWPGQTLANLRDCRERARRGERHRAPTSTASGPSRPFAP